jgi:carbonic anhydrase
LYDDPGEASKSSKNDGLVVMAVFVRVGEHNDAFENLSSFLQEIHLKGNQVPVQNINISALLPNNLDDYWAYKGSLTTPVCGI